MMSLDMQSDRPVPPRPLLGPTRLPGALLALTILWSLADPRLIEGAPVRAKPMEFAASFVVM